MKEYNKPICLVMHINIEQTLLAGSMESAKIGGSTDHFDAKRQATTDFDNDNDW